MQIVHLEGLGQNVLKRDLRQNAVLVLVCVLEHIHETVDSGSLGLIVDNGMIDLILSKTAFHNVQVKQTAHERLLMRRPEHLMRVQVRDSPTTQ
jgi:hypothetical protein